MSNEFDLGKPTVPSLTAIRADAADKSVELEGFIGEIGDLIRSGNTELPPMSEIRQFADRIRTEPEISGTMLQRLIEGEPAVASRVMRLANSAFYRPQGDPVSNLKRALIRLGNQTVANLIETVAMAVFHSHDDEHAVRHLRKLWTHTLYTAIAAREIAQDTRAMDPEDAFLAGMFHNVGETILIRLLAEYGPEKCLIRNNETVLFRFIAKYHEPVGKQTLETWSFPGAVVALAGEHHNEPSTTISAIVIAADESALDYGYSYFDKVPNHEKMVIAATFLELDEDYLAELPRRIGPALNDTLSITLS